MREHFENIKYIHGDANVRLPNSIFRDLSEAVRSSNGKTSIKQIAFAYTYLVTVALLYKYAHFVDVDNGSYIGNADIKELLGYNRGTKSIDKIIKKNGMLDELMLTQTTKDYPIKFETNKNEDVNGILIREFTTISDTDIDDESLSLIKEIVKNRNYEIKDPLFLTTGYKDSEYGTLYSIERTHKINIYEFLKLVFDDELDNIDFLMYGFFKSKCKGYKDNMKAVAVYKIIMEMGIDRGTFYKHLELLKGKGFITVNHKEWSMKSEEHKLMEANEYFWKGVN